MGGGRLITGREVEEDCEYASIGDLDTGAKMCTHCALRYKAAGNAGRSGNAKESNGRPVLSDDTEYMEYRD